MHFTYNPRKAAQSAAYLVRVNGGEMDIYALIKILYLSDRKALTLRGRPITGDAMVSMPYGPVLSQIYDEVSSPEEIRNRFWSEYLTPRNNDSISLKIENPPTDELSEYERNILNETHQNYHHYNFAELLKISHQLPEYEDPQGSSLQIDPATILRIDGWSEDEIRDALMSAREEVFFNDVCRWTLGIRSSFPTRSVRILT